MTRAFDLAGKEKVVDSAGIEPASEMVFKQSVLSVYSWWSTRQQGKGAGFKQHLHQPGLRNLATVAPTD